MPAVGFAQLGLGLAQRAVTAAAPPPPPLDPSALALEAGGRMLLEDGSLLLLE